MSSMASYGPADFQPRGIVDHESTPHPVTFYGESKLQAEQFIESFRDLNYIILRPTAVFGPREKDFLTLYKSIQRGIEMYIGSKDQKLSFIYVRDLVDLIFKSISSDVKRASYFVSDGQVYSSSEYNSLLKKALDKKTIKFVLPLGIVKTIASLAEWSSKMTGKYPIINHDKLSELTAKNWQVDTSLQEDQLGFTPNYTLEEAVNETIQWNIENKKL
jgi:nucleoside-diphosphate-sugar epimerase